MKNHMQQIKLAYRKNARFLPYLSQRTLVSLDLLQGTFSTIISKHATSSLKNTLNVFAKHTSPPLGTAKFLHETKFDEISRNCIESSRS